MINDFDKLRKKLHNSIEINGLNSEKTWKISKRYNELVNFHYQNERQYRSNNFMYRKYQESIRYLKRITIDFVEFPTIKEWNHYAKENDLLNSESIKYMSGSSWHKLRNKIYTNGKKD
ncbi:MAG: hypothetical protein HFJ34_08280 [Clostridia bacterium]|nr:hypothetical protein [Clostridia bacterium]